MVRECFARYLKLTRRALSDASAIAAATAAGITSGGELVQPLEEALRAAELAAAEEAQGYGGSGPPSALEESIAAGRWRGAGCGLAAAASRPMAVGQPACATRNPLPNLCQGTMPRCHLLIPCRLGDCGAAAGAVRGQNRPGELPPAVSMRSNVQLREQACCLPLPVPLHCCLSQQAATHPALRMPLPLARACQVRLDSLLPELSPRDRGAELVEHTVRQHVSLCFAALERRLLATAEGLAAELARPECRRNGEAKQRVMAQGLAVLQALLVQGVERLLRRCAAGRGGWGAEGRQRAVPVGLSRWRLLLLQRPCAVLTLPPAPLPSPSPAVA